MALNTFVCGVVCLKKMKQRDRQLAQLTNNKNTF